MSQSVLDVHPKRSQQPTSIQGMRGKSADAFGSVEDTASQLERDRILAPGRVKRQWSFWGTSILFAVHRDIGSQG